MAKFNELRVLGLNQSPKAPPAAAGRRPSAVGAERATGDRPACGESMKGSYLS